LTKKKEADCFSDGQRCIYYDVRPNENEARLIAQFKEDFKESPRALPEWWSTVSPGEILRYLSTNELDVGKTVEQVNKHLHWLEELKTMKLSDEAAELMRAGAVYIGGRDKNGFPSCIFFE
jgi:hypothetical protein